MPELKMAAGTGKLEVCQYLLDKGADMDKADSEGYTPLHTAALKQTDMNARNDRNELPIDVARTEEIKQAICDEPRRRMDEAPGKRATEQDRHPNAATSVSYSRKKRRTMRRKSQATSDHVSPRGQKQKREKSQRRTRTASLAVTRKMLKNLRAGYYTKSIASRSAVRYQPEIAFVCPFFHH